MPSSNKILILEENYRQSMFSPFLCILGLIYGGFGFLNHTDSATEGKNRIFILEGGEVQVTHEVDDVFYGLYKGAKSGYLLLERDGTGEYRYDIFGVTSSDCKEGVIKFEWGFPLDKNNNKVKFKKLYGYSYPVIFKCSGEICFQGCSKEYILDFILDKNDGKLHVSSSDDWKKEKK